MNVGCRLLLSFASSEKGIYESKQDTFNHTHTNTKPNSHHTNNGCLRDCAPPQKTGGYMFKYQNFFQPCQSLVVTILAGHPNHSASSWYRAVWAKQRKLLLIRTCLVAHGPLCLFWSNYLFGLKLFYLSFLILPVPLLLICLVTSGHFFVNTHSWSFWVKISCLCC